MKTISANCPNCGAPINLDPDNIAKFCSQCGSKILLDVETIQRLLIEKEKTKQVEAKEMAKARQAEMNYKKKSSDNKNTTIMAVAYFIFMTIVLTIIFGFMLLSKLLGKG